MKLKTPNLNFDSMQQASTVCGVPLATLRRAKRNGSPGFLHGRVDLKTVLQWLFTSGASAEKMSPFESLAQARAERERHKLLKEQEAFFDRDEAADYIRKTFMPVREGVLRLPGDLAPQVNPSDPVFAQLVLEKWAEDFLKQCRDSITARPRSADNSEPSKSPDDGKEQPNNGQTPNSKLT